MFAPFVGLILDRLGLLWAFGLLGGLSGGECFVFLFLSPWLTLLVSQCALCCSLFRLWLHKKWCLQCFLSTVRSSTAPCWTDLCVCLDSKWFLCLQIVCFLCGFSWMNSKNFGTIYGCMMLITAVTSTSVCKTDRRPQRWHTSRFLIPNSQICCPIWSLRCLMGRFCTSTLPT